MNYPFLNAINENIIVYNGDFLPDEIKDSVTKSILNLFNKCNSIYDQKICRGPHCYWFILSKNISEYYVLMSLSNIWSKATNKNILSDAMSKYPTILQNIPLFNYIYPYNINYLLNISNYLVQIPNNTTCDSFDLLE